MGTEDYPIAEEACLKKTKICSRCKLEKYRGQFRRHCKRGVQSWCKSCELSYWKERKERDRFLRLFDNLRRHERTTFDLALSELRRLGNPQECYLCGTANLTWATAELDHVTPLSQGGKTTIDNLRWAHRRCNRAKHDMTLSEMTVLFRKILNLHGD